MYTRSKKRPNGCHSVPFFAAGSRRRSQAATRSISLNLTKAIGMELTQWGQARMALPDGSRRSRVREVMHKGFEPAAEEPGGLAAQAAQQKRWPQEMRDLHD